MTDLSASQTLKALRSDLSAALEAVAAKHGITFKTDRISYARDGRSCRVPLDVYVNHADGTAANPDKEQFLLYASRYGMTASDFGREFLFQGKPYVISGLNPKARTAPILATGGGKTYKFAVDAVKFPQTAATPAVPSTTALAQPGALLEASKLVDQITQLHTAPYDRKKDYLAQLKEEDALFAQLQTISDAQPSGVCPGKLLRYQIADGYAHYLITAVGRQVRVRHVPIGDAYHSPVVRNSALSLGHAADACRHQEVLRTLFGRK